MTDTSPSRPTRPPTGEAQPAASRRNFISGGMMLAGGAIVGSNLAVARGAHAFGSDTIKIGLVGCGRRGTVAAIEALATSGGEVRLVAMADAFDNNLHTAYRSINGKHPDKLDLQGRRFAGLDAYLQVMQSDADLVILATPPGFRPLHFEAAIAAGKHVFMEKPVATDAPGVRRVLAAGEIAKANGLAVAVGLQRRHEPKYQQCIQRLQDGAIGDPIFARAYWNGGPIPMRARTKDQTELAYQLRNWCHFTWLGGDQISEQHIHNLDVINWLMDAHPIEAQGQGGRFQQDEVAIGQTFDQHMVEFTYASGLKLLSQCRNLRGCWNGVGEHVHGTKGSADISTGKIYDAKGDLVWQSAAGPSTGKDCRRVQEHLISALRRGELPSETEYGARSTMTAIMGRTATYSGKIVKWDAVLNSSIGLADVDSLHRFEDPAPVLPGHDGLYPVPTPGAKVKHV